MSDLSIIPLQDWFETQLSQEWDGAVGTVYVLATPTYTPTTTDTYIVVSPGKTNMQIARVSDYDSTAKTLTIDSISFNKALGVSSTAQTHPTGSKVIISDNYQFWADIKTAVNSKVDGNSDDVGVYKFADATARDAFLTSPTNWLQAYLTTEWYWTDYVGGAWVQRATGATPNASTTVAGKKEDATSAESIAGTDVWGTGATLSVLPSDIAKNTQSGTFTYGTDSGGDDAYVITLTPALTVYTTGQELKAKMTTANTGACTIDFWPWAKSVKLLNGNDPSDGDIASGKVHVFVYDGTNLILQNPTTTPTATTSTPWVTTLATDALAETWASTTTVITPSQLDKYAVSTSLRNDWMTFVMPIAAINASTIIWWSSAGWTSPTVDADDYWYATGTRIYASWSSASVILRNRFIGSGTNQFYTYAQTKKIRLKWRASFDNTNSFGVGLAITATSIFAAETDTTNGTIRFLCKSGVLYACNANWTAKNTNVDSGITNNQYNTYEIVYNPWVSILFYINWTLVATHTTNLPTTGTPYITIGNSSGNAAGMYISPITLSVEF